MLEQETAKGIDTLAAKTQEVMEQESRPLRELEHRAAQWMLEEFKARNQVAYERYDSLTKQKQGIIDRWQALEYRLNPSAAPVTGNQNSKRFVRNDPYGIFDTRQPVGYDKGKEGGGNELSQAGRGWAQPNQTNLGRPNAYAEYLAYKQKVQARQQSLALEQALQQLLEQEQAARTYAGPQAFAYNGADGFASSGYETGGAAGVGGTGSSGEIDGAYEAGDSFESGGPNGKIINAKLTEKGFEWPSAKGLIGHDFEIYLHNIIGGESSYIKGSTAGRDFDGVFGKMWYEAKSGNYWNKLLQDKAIELRFKQKMSEGLKIAQENGATYELFSNTPIPDIIKIWLTKKGIPFTEILN